jgi:hypothetical protein
MENLGEQGREADRVEEPVPGPLSGRYLGLTGPLPLQPGADLPRDAIQHSQHKQIVPTTQK